MTFFADFTSGQSNVSYTRMRQLLATSGGGLQEGVVAAGDLKVSQRGAGANMSVDVAVGDAWVQYDTGTRNGLSHVWSDAVANVAFNASDATNPRIDQIGVQLNDTSVGAGTGGNTPTLRYLAGTATAGAQAANPAAAGYRAGAAAAPNDWMRLADVLVPATSTSVTTANIVDRRPWARGAFVTSNIAGANATTTVAAEIDTANYKKRIECSGRPIEFTFVGSFTHSVANGLIDFALAQDGTVVTDSTRRAWIVGGGSSPILLCIRWTITPAAGSHQFCPFWTPATAGTLTLLRVATPNPSAEFTVHEVTVGSVSND